MASVERKGNKSALAEDIICEPRKEQGNFESNSELNRRGLVGTGGVLCEIFDAFDDSDRFSSLLDAYFFLLKKS